jgi:hypothetical protein
LTALYAEDLASLDNVLSVPSVDTERRRPRRSVETDCDRDLLDSCWLISLGSEGRVCSQSYTGWVSLSLAPCEQSEAGGRGSRDELAALLRSALFAVS